MFKKFFFILGYKQKIKFYFLIFLVFITLIFELLSISLIFPLLVFITEVDIFLKYPFIKNYSQMIGINNRTQLITYSIIFISSIYLFKIIYNLTVVVLQYRYSYDLQEKLSNKLFNYYLRVPYLFHINKNSAFLIRNITEEVNMFIINCVLPVIYIISEGFVLLGILAFLFFMEPQGALMVILLLAVCVVVLNHISEKKTNYYADLRQENIAIRLKILQQSLGIIDELKILGREEHFINKFKKSMKNLADSFRVQHIFLDVPRLALELIAIITFMLLILYLFITDDKATHIIPTIGVFAAAAFRVLPSTNRFLASLQRVKYARPVINFLYSEFVSISEDKKIFINKELNNYLKVNKIKLDREINFKNISFGYSDKRIIENLNLKIKKGEAIGIVGQSGVGKSTFLRLLTGLIKPNNGNIELDGKDMDKNFRAWQNSIGYVPQFVYLLDDTIKNNIGFGISEENIDIKKINESINLSQIGSFVETLDLGINTIVGEKGIKISGGQRQRIGIARAVYNSPEILVFDEPTSSLDEVTEKNFFDSIYNFKENKTLIIVTHKKTVLNKCDKIYELKNKKLFEIN